MTDIIASQTHMIAAHLISGRAITPMEALSVYGCFRLAARIKDLRDDGYDILTEWETDGVKRWGRYILLKHPKKRLT